MTDSKSYAVRSQAPVFLHLPKRVTRMLWSSIFLAILLQNATASSKRPLPQPARVQLLAAEVGDESAYDSQAEKDLLALSNRARSSAGLPPFQMDEGLARAARQHATEMALRRELSHQFPGESALSQRISGNSKLYLIEVAENVGLAESPDRVHDALMHSPPHRENLLHP